MKHETLEKEEKEKTYPDCYLHVQEMRSGNEWIMPLRSNSILDLTRQVKKWIKKEFNGQLFLYGRITSKLEGEFYGRIMTDGRPPESIVCWNGGGFYLCETPNNFGLRN